MGKNTINFPHIFFHIWSMGLFFAMGEYPIIDELGQFLSSVQWPIIPIQNSTSLFPLTFLSKHISVYALGRLKWILDIIWPLNQLFNLKNQRNWKKQVWMLNFWLGLLVTALMKETYFTSLAFLETACLFNFWKNS